MILKENRDSARTEAVKAIRYLEKRLIDALDGDRLYGMPNLATSNNPFYGARVRCKHLDTPIRRPLMGKEWSNPTLALTDRGALVMVSRSKDERINYRLAEDDDFTAQDAPRLTELIHAVLEEHAKKQASRAKTFSRLELFSRTVNRILEETENE